MFMSIKGKLYKCYRLSRTPMYTVNWNVLYQEDLVVVVVVVDDYVLTFINASVS